MGDRRSGVAKRREKEDRRPVWPPQGTAHCRAGALLWDSLRGTEDGSRSPWLAGKEADDHRRDTVGSGPWQQEEPPAAMIATGDDRGLDQRARTVKTHLRAEVTVGRGMVAQPAGELRVAALCSRRRESSVLAPITASQSDRIRRVRVEEGDLKLVADNL
ncbi:hypothetical protein NDU88_001989 [Pleurodeles waltl]|uniref:Uncharacterized protein n=1 Tax=Pleurodeles waltl TaxID=8319 RepID=A0AAV7VBP9_PLEWA|nr:hypothetical protein NDU88_001989 [Pleurodeles waltl]